MFLLIYFALMLVYFSCSSEEYDVGVIHTAHARTQDLRFESYQTTMTFCDFLTMAVKDDIFKKSLEIDGL